MYLCEEDLENLILIRQIEGKTDRGKQHMTYLVRMSEWMAEQGL